MIDWFVRTRSFFCFGAFPLLSSPYTTGHLTLCANITTTVQIVCPVHDLLRNQDYI